MSPPKKLFKGLTVVVRNFILLVHDFIVVVRNFIVRVHNFILHEQTLVMNYHPTRLLPTSLDSLADPRCSRV